MESQSDCSACGAKNSVQVDHVHSESGLVCTECGVMTGQAKMNLQDAVHEHQPEHSGRFYFSSSLCTAPEYQTKVACMEALPPNARLLGGQLLRTRTRKQVEASETIKRLTEHFNMEKHHFFEAIDLVKKTYRSFATAKRTHLACVCVYLIARRHRFPMQMRDVATAGEMDLTAFGRLFRRVQEATGVEVARSGAELETVIHQQASRAGFSQALAKTAVQLAEFSMNMAALDRYLGQREVLASVFLYMAWVVDQLAQPNDQSPRTNIVRKGRRLALDSPKELSKFVNTYHLAHERISHAILMHVLNVCANIATTLPWVSEQVTAKTVGRYLLDVLKHAKNPSDEAATSTYNQCKDFVARKPRKRRRHSSPEEHVYTTTGDLYSEELTEADLPDDQLGHYIRSNSEIEQVQRLMSGEEKILLEARSLPDRKEDKKNVELVNLSSSFEESFTEY